MMYNSEVAIETIGQYIQEIFRLKKYVSKNTPTEYIQWYRGQADITWQLEPKVQRDFLGNYEELLRRERYFTTEFQVKASILQTKTPPLSDYTNWLTLMQHYGLPTRLLDWSQSPLIALYFAVSDKSEEEHDACVWMLTPDKLNESENLEKPSIVDGKTYPNTFIYSMAHNTIYTMVFTAFKRWDLSDDSDAISPDDKKFNHRMDALKDKISACYPTEADGRVYNQHAAFTVHNSSRKLHEFCDDRTLLRITIPNNKRNDLLNELKLCGITESYIYPDLEHLAKELKLLDVIKKK